MCDRKVRASLRTGRHVTLTAEQYRVCRSTSLPSTLHGRRNLEDRMRYTMLRATTAVWLGTVYVRGRGCGNGWCKGERCRPCIAHHSCKLLCRSRNPRSRPCRSMRSGSRSSRRTAYGLTQTGGRSYEVRQPSDAGLAVEYRRPGTDASVRPGWRIDAATAPCGSRRDGASPNGPMRWCWNSIPHRCHATLLGKCREDGSIELPAVLHLPDQGSIQIRSGSTRRVASLLVRCAARRRWLHQDHVSGSDTRLSGCRVPVGCRGDPPAACRQMTMTSRFAALRRNWLNIFQWNPRLRTLANHSASDTCAFCLYEYADIALHTPPLAENLTALDLVRQSLDRYLDGMPGYGLPGYVGFDMPRRSITGSTVPGQLSLAVDCRLRLRCGQQG